MPDPVAPVPPATPPVAPVAPAPVPPVMPPSDTPAVAVSENVAGSIVMPHVAATRVRIAGEYPTDRGEAAEFLVLGGRVGEFIRGSRLTAEDIGKDAERMIELGSIARLPKAATPEPAKTDGKPDDKKGK